MTKVGKAPMKIGMSHLTAVWLIVLVLATVFAAACAAMFAACLVAAFEVADLAYRGINRIWGSARASIG